MTEDATNEGVGVLVVSDAPAFLASAFERSGFTVHVVDGLDLDGPDRELLKELEARIDRLAAEPDVDGRVAVVGSGRGGTLAFMLGCVSSNVGAVVVDGAPLVYAELSRERPMQPLEMALNLACPLLALVGDADPSIPPEHAARMEDVLSQFFRTFDIVTHPGSGTVLTEATELGVASLDRVASFLSDTFESD